MAMMVPAVPAAVRIAWACLAPAYRAVMPVMKLMFKELDRAKSSVKICVACMCVPHFQSEAPGGRSVSMVAVQAGVLEASRQGWTLSPWLRRQAVYAVGVLIQGWAGWTLERVHERERAGRLFRAASAAA